MIAAVATWGIAAGTEAGRTGVWVKGHKLASIGIAVRRWVGYHGFALNVDPDLASFDASASAWVAEPGAYTLKIGASSTDVKQTLSVELPRSIVVEKVHRVLTPSVAIEEMKPKK